MSDLTVVTVSSVGPDKDLPGHVRLDLGCFHALISGNEAADLARRLLNHAAIAQGIANLRPAA
jgi:hypothetical protein